MRRAILALLLAVAAVAFAAPPEDFSNIIDFSISTADLVEIVQTGQYDRLDPTKYLVLQGSVASTAVYNPDVEAYTALVELVDSRWVGLDTIEVYRVYVLLEGPDFADRVVERIPRDPGPEIILANSEILVIGAFIGEADGEDGSILPVVTAIAIR